MCRFCAATPQLKIAFPKSRTPNAAAPEGLAAPSGSIQDGYPANQKGCGL
jgi:hypothetical protein